MSRPQNRFQALPGLKNRPFAPQKGQNDPRNRSKLKVIIEGDLINKNYSPIWVDSRSDF